MKFTLRPYQSEALDKVAAAEARGVRRQLGVAATGTGKTVVFCALAERRGGRTLILAHRDELVSQAAAKVREVWPEATVGVCKAERNEVRAQVVVASVQTLARPNRLAQLLAAQDGTSVLIKPADPFGLVVVDEAHRTAAVTYRGILTALRAGEADGPLLLGVTATPDRGDGKGLDDLFDEITFNYDLLWGIRAGYLSDMRGLRVTVDSLDLSGVKVRRGDYDAGQAGRAMEDAGAPEVIVKAWLEHASDRRTLVFTPTVETARLTAEAFTHAGVAAAYVHGGTPLDERRRLLDDYQSGAVQVLANCAVLTEGYDAPRTDCVVMARPTKSRALFTQCVGRGSRRHPDKADCLVLDVVGASTMHSLVTVPSLFGLGEGYAERMGTGEGRLSEVVQERDDELVLIGKLRAEEADLFRALRAEVAWVSVHTEGAPLRRYVRPLGREADGTERPTVVLAQRSEHEWTAGLWWPRGSHPGPDGFRIHTPERKAVLVADVALETAQGVAEDYVRQTADRLTAADAKWRKGKPSPRAKAAAKKWRMKVDPKWTAGELSDHLDAHIARVKARASTPPRWTEYVPVADLQPAPRNAKAHDQEALGASLDAFGAIEAVVVDEGTGRIVAGHGRAEKLMAMQTAGAEPPEGVVVDESGRWCWLVTRGWSSRDDAHAEAAGIALNRVGERGGWETGVLSSMLDDLALQPDLLDAVGWSADELDELIAASRGPGPDPWNDRPKRPMPAPGNFEGGQVWQVGEHRLVVGDARDPAVWAWLPPAHLMVTDPPYGIAYGGGGGLEREAIEGDGDPAEAAALLDAVLGRLVAHACAGAPTYIALPGGSAMPVLLEVVHRYGLHRWSVVWVKDRATFGRADFHPQHEHFAYGWTSGPRLVPIEDRTVTTVWNFARPSRSEFHPSAKPVPLMQRMVELSSHPGDVVGGPVRRQRLQPRGRSEGGPHRHRHRVDARLRQGRHRPAG